MTLHLYYVSLLESTPQKVQLFEETCSVSLQPLGQSVYFPELGNRSDTLWNLLFPSAGIQLIAARGGLTSPSPRGAVWTAPVECSAGPGPASALGSCGPVPELTRRCSASVSHFLPWSRVVHCGAPGTAAPTGDSEQVVRLNPGPSLVLTTQSTFAVIPFYWIKGSFRRILHWPRLPASYSHVLAIGCPCPLGQCCYRHLIQNKNTAFSGSYIKM